MLPRILLLTIALISFNTSFTSAQETARDGYVQAQLISEARSIQPGHPFWVAVQLKMDSGWHIYWKNPGDSGLPTKIQWNLPDQFQAGPIQWPYPKRITIPPLTSYGYDDEVFLLTQIDPPPTLSVDEAKEIKARVDWLMCKEICIPGHADIKIQLPVKDEPPQINLQWSKDFVITRSKLPLDKSDWTITAHNENGSLTLNLTYPAEKKYPLSEAYFFPERDDLIKHADQQILKEIDSGYELRIPRSSLSSQPLKELKGVLFSTEQTLSVDIPVRSSAAKIDPAPQQNPLNLPIALLFAFLGGLILNLMPCVLPVLSLKILGLVKQSGEDKTKMWIHGAVFTSGVVVSFWVLAGALLLFRITGQQIGWGFQFQSPLFLIFLSAVFFIFALNLFGVFEISLPFQIKTPQQRSGLLSDFLNGVLATITATPCTAPFMGTALGFALTQSPQISFLIFTALAVGMAFPYLLLSFFPSLLGFLPKPGPWMINFKRFLGTLLIGTVLWLLWILGTQLGVIKDQPSSPRHQASQITWQNYSPELIQQLRSQNRMIFIDFTAKWCLSCQVNERIALDNPEVIKKFKELNVAMIKADWTSQDVNITEALAEFGKNSIPLYVLYGKDPTADAIILPEIITPKAVLAILDKINR